MQVRCSLTCWFRFLFQDQLSADMYSFVAKEIDYASYFQTVSMDGIGMRKKNPANSDLILCINLYVSAMSPCS